MWYLGIDGGQSSTTAVIGNEEGIILGRGMGGPSNHVYEPGGIERLRSAITKSVTMALTQFTDVEFLEAKFESAFCGMTGDPREQAGIIAEVIKAEHLVVEHDSVIALAAATAGEPGIVIIAGTGSVALGVNERGQRRRVGGWGYLFGDEGSAFDIARRGAMAALKYLDGRAPRTIIGEKILQEVQMNDLEQFLKAVYSGQFSRDRLAALAVCVEAAAREGDEVAREILKTRAEALAAMVASLFEQLGGFGERVKVSWIGGVFNSLLVREHFEQRLKALIPSVEVSPPQFEPAIGALLLAYKTVGLFPSQQILENIRRSLGREP